LPAPTVLSRARRFAPHLVQLALLGGLVLAVSRVLGSDLIHTMAVANPGLLVASLAAATAAHAMQAGRWWSLAPVGHGYPRLCRIHIESHFWATFVPGGVAADGYRVLALRGKGADPHRTAASVVLERALGTAVLLALCGPALAFGAAWLSAKLLISLSVLAGLLALMLAAGTIGALYAPVGRGRMHWLPRRIRAGFGAMEDAFSGYRGEGRRFVRAAVFAIAYHGCFLAAYALAGTALGIELSLGRWFIAVPLASLAATLPLNAWGIGVREGALTLLLVTLGASPAQAAAASVVVVGSQLLLGCSGGISQLLRRIGGVPRTSDATDPLCASGTL
jgi:glycosyltransferase 2 family protein